MKSKAPTHRSLKRKAGNNKPNGAAGTSKRLSPTLELGPPVASENSERWLMLGNEALETPAQRRRKPKPDADRERWLKALSHAASPKSARFYRMKS
jgi:hypothetical protein